MPYRTANAGIPINTHKSEEELTKEEIKSLVASAEKVIEEEEQPSIEALRIMEK